MTAAPHNDPRFPRSHTDAYVTKVANALRNTPGVTLTLTEAADLARLTTTKVAELVNRKGVIADDRLVKVETRTGAQLLFLETDTVPVLPNPANPRIEPGMRQTYSPATPPRPTTPANTTRVVFDYPDDKVAIEHHRHAERELHEAASPASRGYDLVADMAHRGQREHGVAVLADVVFTQNGTTFRQPRLVAVTGNNRADVRLQILGISFGEIIFAPSDMRTMWDQYVNGVWAIAQTGDDPAEVGVESFAPNQKLLEVANRIKAYGLDSAVLNLRARNRVLIGWDPAGGELSAQLDELNLDTHLHPPAAFDENARGLALFSTIVQLALRDDLITPANAAALLGRCDAVTGGYADESAKRFDEIRLLFPPVSEPRLRQIVQEVLAEPIATRTNKAHASVRCRVLGAVWFGGQSNPRLADGLFTHSHTRAGVTIPWPDMTTLLTAAATDDAARRFALNLAPLLLAEAGLYEASRGSNPLRREPGNLARALDRKPALAMSLVIETYDALNTGRPPTLPGVATLDAAWLTTTFPKTGSTPPPLPNPTPTPPVDPAVALRDLQASSISALDDVLGSATIAIGALKKVTGHARGESLPMESGYTNNIDSRTTSVIQAIMVDLQGEVANIKFAAAQAPPLVSATVEADGQP